MCRGLQISFEDTPELSTPPPTLFQTTRKFAGRLYIIDVLSEPPLATAFPSNQEEKVHDDEVEEFLLLRCRMYDPEFSRYYEATAHDRLPREIKERRSKVKKLVSMLEVAEMDEHTGRPMRFGFPAKDGAEKEREEAKEAEEKVEKVEKVAVAAPPLASPRLRSAFKDAKNFEIALNDATERVRTLPLSSLSSSSAFSKAELDARESVWQLRRDHALLQKRENLQKRFGKSSKKGACVRISVLIIASLFSLGEMAKRYLLHTLLFLPPFCFLLLTLLAPLLIFFSQPTAIFPSSCSAAARRSLAGASS